MTKHTILSMLKKEQPFLKKEYGVKRLAIFGSFAHGRPKAGSDVDLFVEFDRPVGLRFFDFVGYLEKKTGRTVDVLTPGGLRGIRLKKVADHIRRSLVDVQAA